MALLLTIELVPSTCWYSNVRSNLSPEKWQTIKEYTFNLAGNVCEICYGIGKKWPVECHEVWVYDDINKIQKLERTIALCPSCHQVKHIGYAKISGNYNFARSHFARINSLSIRQADIYIQKAFEKFHERSLYQWELDITWLNKIVDL